MYVGEVACVTLKRSFISTELFNKQKQIMASYQQSGNGSDFSFSARLVGPSQGAPGQYPNYPQGQGQQYGAYRPPQPGPPQGQPQRPYGYDQVSRQ